MITYQTITEKPVRIQVYLDGKKVGQIRQADSSHFYYQIGKICGYMFPSVAAVKRSIESEV